MRGLGRWYYRDVDMIRMNLDRGQGEIDCMTGRVEPFAITSTHRYHRELALPARSLPRTGIARIAPTIGIERDSFSALLRHNPIPDAFSSSPASGPLCKQKL